MLYVCTFAEKGSAEVLRDTALKIGGADHVLVMDENHKLIKLLKSKETTDLRFEWGYWKPYVIDFVMHNVQEGDVVAYVDCGLKFTGPLPTYSEDVVLFPDSCTLKKFCTEDCFKAAGVEDSSAIKNATMVDSRVQVYRKSPASMAFVKKYLDMCSTPEAMDTKHRVPNDPSYEKHLHEKSCLSVLGFYKKTFLGKNHFLETSETPEIKKVIVVTPTIGTPYLARCIESVQSQDLLGVEHLIVVDGHEYADAVERIVEPYLLKKPLRVMVLPFNVGAGGWCGHRVYASIPFLLDADYVAYLDEDNVYQKNHLSSMLHLVSSKNLDWAYSLRTIVDKNGTFIAHDNCESLGGLCHTVLGWQDFLVDTSCYFLSMDVAKAISPKWMHKTRQENGQEADRTVARYLLAHETFKGGCTRKHSLHYMVDSASTSVSGKFFMEANQMLKYDFQEKPTVYIFHFNAEQTAKFLVTMHRKDRSYALDEWQMTLLRGLSSKYNLVNGFAVEPFIEPGSVIYVSMCHMHELPSKTLQRTDIHKILYTLESPNIRHQQQWNLSFLKTFDHLLTYWTPLLTKHPSATFCPHNTHHLDLDNPLDRHLLVPRKDKVKRDVVMVLECRDLGGSYEINGVPLKCLDPLRKFYVESLKDITVYGLGWDRFKANANLKIGHTKHRSLDDRSTVDIIKNYTFVLIVENTDADGYVSEKIYDAWIAGCIPIYYGNNNDNVNIPQDMYIDLRAFATSQDLQKYLDKLTLKEILAKRNFILKNRDKVLQKVSTQAFAETFQTVYDKIHLH